MIHPPTLDSIRFAANLWPTDLLKRLEIESALMLFCAGFYGASDCIHVADAEVSRVTAVDLDEERVAAMRAVYPSHWLFVVADVWTGAHLRGSWDLVAVDPPIADSFLALSALPRFAAAARKAIVLGLAGDATRQIADVVPEGWERRRLVWRNSEACWLVLERSST